MHRLITLLLFCILTFPCLGGDSKPNIIVIVSDDLGFADVGFNGAIDFDTPHLDALAASGVQFTNGYVTHPYCSPSRAGILTGRYQQRFGHECNPMFDYDNDEQGTPTDEVFLSQVLKNQGYRTFAIGKWHLGDAPRFLPTRRGFDEFFGFSGGGFNFYGIPNRREPRNRVLRGEEPVPLEELSYLTDDFSDEAVKFIERNRDSPFFIYLAYNAVHAPNHATQEYLDRTMNIEDGFRTVYAAMMLAMDDGIGRVMSTLEETGIREDTLVFFVNDNGGRLGSDNRPLRGHKGLLYDGGIRVPFLASWPGMLPEGLRYEEPVIALDIFPTAAAAAGANVAGGKPLDGVDLMPFLTGEKAYAPHDVLYWRVLGGKGYAVREGRYKLVKRAATEKVELFDLESDLRETTDLAKEKPGILRHLSSLYEVWNAELMEPRWSDPHGENVVKEFQSVHDARQKALPPKK